MATQSSTIEKDKVKDSIPNQWKVIMLNDNVTPMELVIEILMKIFKHDEVTAKEIMLTVHNSGSGVAGIYAYEIAEQKALEAVNRARVNGYPFKIIVEEEI